MSIVQRHDWHSGIGQSEGHNTSKGETCIDIVTSKMKKLFNQSHIQALIVKKPC